MGPESKCSKHPYCNLMSSTWLSNSIVMWSTLILIQLISWCIHQLLFQPYLHLQEWKIRDCNSSIQRKLSCNFLNLLFEYSVKKIIWKLTHHIQGVWTLRLVTCHLLRAQGTSHNMAHIGLPYLPTTSTFDKFQYPFSFNWVKA